ncbi:histidine triad nucleotide-binding protein [Candidatus Daviesbacteria bacterium]|nr:histidine triad nucleotide-binding protein [Candidatus Daviesbacteria bacterium]
MENCIFCKIIKKEIPSNIVYESDSMVAFPDINPSAETHILIVPKQHIGSIQDISKENGQLLAEVYLTASKLVSDYNLTNNFYKVVVNGGKAQHVPHLHFHLLGGNLKRMV